MAYTRFKTVRLHAAHNDDSWLVVKMFEEILIGCGDGDGRRDAKDGGKARSNAG